MKGFFFLKVWAKIVGGRSTWRNTVRRMGKKVIGSFSVRVISHVLRVQRALRFSHSL